MDTSELSNLAKSADLFQVAQKVSQDVKDYLVVAEQEHTKRTQIIGYSKVELARIEAVRSTFERFLDRSFDERRKNFEELFSIVRDSMAKGDMKTLESSLAAVVELAKVSPLAEARSLASLRSAMDDPEHEFRI
jgi:vacuolar-type H+-ATPase subunit I/STV1